MPGFCKFRRNSQGYFPFDLSHAAIDAGRVMLKRIKELTDTKEDFALKRHWQCVPMPV
jgi:hypothetical protein